MYCKHCDAFLPLYERIGVPTNGTNAGGGLLLLGRMTSFVSRLTTIAAFGSVLGLVACTAPAPVQKKPAPLTDARDEDKEAIRAILKKTFAVPDSAVSPWVTIRGDTAWAYVRADSISTDIARLERRAGSWVYIRIDATAIKND
jgi:hypothetical protein